MSAATGPRRRSSAASCTRARATRGLRARARYVRAPRGRLPVVRCALQSEVGHLRPLNRQEQSAFSRLGQDLARRHAPAILGRSLDSSTKFRRIRYFAKAETGNFVVRAKKVLMRRSAILPYRSATIILQCNKRCCGNPCSPTGPSPRSPDEMNPSRGAAMSETYSPQAAAEQARDSFRQSRQRIRDPSSSIRPCRRAYALSPRRP